MGCNCGSKRTTIERYTVTLPGGLRVTKTSKAAAEQFVAKHPGATMAKAS